MFTRHQALLLAALTLPALLCAAGAGAQNAVAQNAPDKRPPETNGSAIPSGVLPAPVGHRQPRASDIPAGAQSFMNDEDRRQLQPERELDKQLQICRGC